MKCIHCGKEMAQGDQFCPKCGKSQEFVPEQANFGFRPAAALDFNDEITESEMSPIPVREEHYVPSVAPIPYSETVKPVVPVVPKRRLVNWKMLGCITAMLALIVGGIYAISEGGLFSGSDSGSSRSKRDRSDRKDRDDDSYYDYDYDDYGYDYGYDDYDPQPSYYDCPGCTNGWHDLCNGSGIYRNYGEAVECSCDDGICNQCGGEGIIYYN